MWWPTPSWMACTMNTSWKWRRRDHDTMMFAEQ
jgi:hypothetical protein